MSSTSPIRPGLNGQLCDARIQAYRGRVEDALGHCLQCTQEGLAPLQDAMRYAVLDGGKRIRPLLVYAAGELFDAPPERLDGPACALELIHCYSLVHDDLPAMDDDDLRRGRPTCHRKYGVGVAILVGDALQALAFEVLCADTDVHTPAMVLDLTRACGSAGMVGGQYLDIAAARENLDLAHLERMHRMKTGALIRAAVRLGAHAGGGNDDDLRRLDIFSDALGLAFQAHDDILDVEGNTAILGKPQGSDQDAAKPTFPSLLGMAESRHAAYAYRQRALDAIAPYGKRAELLAWLADYTVARDH